MKKRRLNREWYNNRKDITGEYSCWRYGRIGKLILWALIVFLARFMFVKVEHPTLIDLYLKWWSFLLLFICLPLSGMLHELQSASQNTINQYLLDGKETYHFLEIFPHKGIRIHRRENHAYRRKIRRFKRLIRK